VRLVGVGLATVLIAATAAAVGSVIGGGDESATTSSTRPVELSPEAQELAGLLARRDDAVYHARYQGTSPDVDGLTLESWQRPPRVRQDSEMRSGVQVVRTSVVDGPDGRTQCVRLGDEPRQCRPAVQGESVDDPLAAIRERLGHGEVTARDEVIQGRPVRCFALTAVDATADLCLLPANGIPMRVVSGGSRLALVALDETVDDEAFVPPAAS
jgi:hypothetical protein